MITPKVVDIRLVLLDHLQDAVEEAGVFSLPATRFLKLPAVDDVAVEDEVFAAVLLEEAGNLFGFGPFRSQVNIRNDDRLEGCLHSTGFALKLAAQCKSIMFRLLRFCFEFEFSLAQMNCRLRKGEKGELKYQEARFKYQDTDHVDTKTKSND